MQVVRSQHERHQSEVHSEPSQTFKMKRLVKIVNGFQTLTIFARSSILNV